MSACVDCAGGGIMMKAVPSAGLMRVICTCTAGDSIVKALTDIARGAPTKDYGERTITYRGSGGDLATDVFHVLKNNPKALDEFRTAFLTKWSTTT